jgi:hypothetical protein
VIETLGEDPINGRDGFEGFSVASAAQRDGLARERGVFDGGLHAGSWAWLLIGQR